VKVVDLPTFARAWAVNPTGFGWLLGAGASAAAGIPTADQISDELLLRLYISESGLDRDAVSATDLDLRRRIHEHYSGKSGLPPIEAPEFYGQIFQRTMPSPATRKAFLEGLFADRHPCFGQQVFGTFLLAGHINLAATTNFDPLIELACAAAHQIDPDSTRLLTVASLGSVDRATTAIAANKWPLLIKLHGDFAESELWNLESELQKQDQALRAAVLDASCHLGLAVAGYSGRDGSVVDMLAAADAPHGRRWPNGIWWITRPGEDVRPELRTRLEAIETTGVEVFLVEAENFDETMAALAAQMDLTPQVRSYIRNLRPQLRVRDVTPPEPGSAPNTFPILRLNALPIVGQPTEALRVALAPNVDRPVFEAAMREARWRGCAALGGDHVLAFGNPEELAKLSCVQGPVERVPFDVLLDNAHGTVVSLASEAIARAIARPLRAKVQARHTPHRVRLRLLDQGEAEPPGHGTLSAAYKAQLMGHLPKPRYGETRDGGAREYAEGIKLHVQRAMGTSWLIFEPFTWTEPSADQLNATDGKRRPNLAGPWINERWTQRKRNEDWAPIIDAWASVIAPYKPTTQLHALSLAISQAGGVGGSFLIGHTTAYSRVSS
jgi:hypothetical protein